MRTVTNTKLAQRNRQIATYLFIVTLVMLIGGFFLVNQSLFTNEAPDTAVLILQSIILPLAFILTLISVRMTNLWARQPRPEDALEEALSGINKKSILYNYHHFPVRHLLICPQGVYVLVTRWHEGSFSVKASDKGDVWRSLQGFFGRFFTTIRMDGIGNPTKDAHRLTEHARKLLAPIAPDVKIEPLIVFLSPNVELDIDNPSVTVLYADPREEESLKNFLRESNANTGKKISLPLTDEQISAFEKGFLPADA
jgi:hypothetical protein